MATLHASPPGTGPAAVGVDAPMHKTLVKTPSQKVRDLKIVYLSNLPYTVAVPTLCDIFEEEGCSVAHIEILKKGSGSSATGAGLAVVTMETEDDKAKALEKMEGKLCFGRPMAVRPDKFV